MMTANFWRTLQAEFRALRQKNDSQLRPIRLNAFEIDGVWYFTSNRPPNLPSGKLTPAKMENYLQHGERPEVKRLRQDFEACARKGAKGAGVTDSFQGWLSLLRDSGYSDRGPSGSMAKLGPDGPISREDWHSEEIGDGIPEAGRIEEHVISASVRYCNFLIADSMAETAQDGSPTTSNDDPCEDLVRDLSGGLDLPEAASQPTGAVRRITGGDEPSEAGLTRQMAQKQIESALEAENPKEAGRIWVAYREQQEIQGASRGAYCGLARQGRSELSRWENKKLKKGGTADLAFRRVLTTEIDKPFVKDQTGVSSTDLRQFLAEDSRTTTRSRNDYDHNQPRSSAYSPKHKSEMT